MLFLACALAVLLAGLGGLKFWQVKAAAGQSSYQPPPEAVTTIVARLEAWPETVTAIGTATAVQGVTVSADAPGIVAQIAFDSGRSVRKGEVLVRLDASQELAQLTAAEAERELTRLNLDRIRGLRDQGVTSQAEYDRVAAEFTQAEARVGEIRATIERKTIRAPFSGILGIRQVNLGQYLNGGDPVVPLQALDPIYVDFAVPQQQVGQLRAGREVAVRVDGLGDEPFAGTITAIDSVVDEATRNARAQATLANGEGRLRPGMFVEVSVVLDEGGDVVVLPVSSVSYAPFGDSVFVVEDVQAPDGSTYRGVRQQFVKLGPGRGDQVAVLEGVAPGEEVVTSGAFKLRTGAAVLVDNSVQPPNEPAPQPEDS
jgi:membrane fusion protein (multidrug efflux system)